MPHLFRYVGPDEIRRRAAQQAAGTVIRSSADFRAWLAAHAPESDPDGAVTITFVIGADGFLRVADRRSEHVACAGADAVQSAGELRLTVAEPLAVVEASNQSTGFCPPPESWDAVAQALDGLGWPHPGRFTRALIFRRCESCGQINVVKDDWWACENCAAELPATWNFTAPNADADARGDAES